MSDRPTRRVGGAQVVDATNRSEHVEQWQRMGLVSCRIPRDMLARNALELPHHPAVIEGDVVVTWADLADAAAGVAAHLQLVGVGPGDVVCWQLPTWWESVVVAHAIWMAGAVSNPIVMMFREHELAQVLAATQPACVVTTPHFRSGSHTELFDDVCRDLTITPARVSVRGESPGWTPLSTLLNSRRTPRPIVVDPDDPALLLYTSGTESSPKAVVHTASTLVAAAERGARTRALDWTDRAYAGGASMAHVGGLERVLLGTLAVGHAAVIRERWDADQAYADMVRHGVTFTSGSTVFIRELSDVVEAAAAEFSLRKGFMCGGSTMVESVIDRAQMLGLHPVRGYGMTEYCGSFSTALLSSPDEIRLRSDGVVTAGGDLRIDGSTDADGSTVGELAIRGPALAIGYLDLGQTRNAYDDDGWFRTGDVGLLRSDGALVVTGRTKDIINRGGEKIAAQEIELLLMSHDDVTEVAVVAGPHARLGEQPAAFVCLRPGSSADEVELSNFLRRRGLALQKVPTIWRWCESDLPRSAGGKVRKDELRRSLWTA